MSVNGSWNNTGYPGSACFTCKLGQVELKIEKLIYGGDGLARPLDAVTGRARAVFVPFSISGETVEASILEQKSGFSRARLDSVVRPSPARVDPQCHYFYRCGGCHYQHIDYQEQLRSKAAILEETLARTAKIKLDCPIKTHAAEPWGYRNRTRMRVVHSPEFAVGYYQFGSHALLAAENCPISSPLINRALTAFWASGRKGQIDPSVREVQFFANHGDARLLLELYAEHGGNQERLLASAAALRELVPEIAGVAFFQGAPQDDNEDQRTSPSRSRNSRIGGSGEQVLAYHASGFEFQVAAGAFFQTNRFLLDTMISLVTGGRSGTTAFDLFAGVGTFTLPLSKTFDQVVAVEISPYSFSGLKSNTAGNIRAIRATTEQFLQSEAKRYVPEVIVIDPPRAGMGERAARLLGRTPARRIVYVSCDPATLSRDVRVLLESGFQVEEAHVLDLFPQTFHIESVLHLVR